MIHGIFSSHYAHGKENSNPVGLRTDDTLFNKVIVQNTTTLNDLLNGIQFAYSDELLDDSPTMNGHTHIH